MSKYVQTIRGVVNVEITNNFASDLGTTLGNYLGPGKRVIIGRDISVPSRMIKRSLTTGLMAAGLDVIDLGVAPIPVIHYNGDFYNANVVITISKYHLRPEKVDIMIFSDHEIPLNQKHAAKVPWNEIGDLRLVHEYRENYIKAVLKHIKTDIVNNKAFLIVLDSEEGTNMPFAPQILNELNCETVLIGSKDHELDDDFSVPHPKRISLVSELTTAIGADMGILLDNDSDRVVFIDPKGHIIRDQTILGIFAKYALEEHLGGNIV
jgi:phosphomannomutase/phosphoglucomutase